MWIESHSDIWTHFKTRRIQKRLGIPLVEVVGHLHSLWHFTLDNAWQTGNLGRWGDLGIEEACRWAGTTGVFLEALREAGLLCNGRCEEDGISCQKAPTEERVFVHDWLDFAGELVKKKIKRHEMKAVDHIQTLEEAGLLFDEFFNIYPRPIKKVEAARAWVDLMRSGVTAKQVVDGLRYHLTTTEWLKEGGVYVPGPDKFLSLRRFEERPRQAPPPPAAAAAPCAYCKTGVRLPGSMWCKDHGWCAVCDDEGGGQKFQPNELLQGPGGTAVCPNHAPRTAPQETRT